LWIVSIKLFGRVVMIVQERISEPSFECQMSHKPAKANGSLDFNRIYIGVFDFPSEFNLHSKNPSAKTKHRFHRIADRKEGFSANVSARAFINRFPIFGSFAQEGISPQM
jgi:hypothetical protein